MLAMPHRTAPLARLLAVEAAAVALLGTFARSAGPGRATATGFWVHASATDLALVTLWWAAAACAAWCIVTTAAGIAGRVVPALCALTRVERFAPAVVRRALEGVLVVSLGTGGVGALAAAPAHAATEATTVATRAPRDEPVVRAPVPHIRRSGPVVRRPPTASATTPTSTPATASAPTPTTAPAPPPTAPAPAPAAPPSAPAARPSTHVVLPGENLWRIAADHLAAVRGRAQADGEVVGYWRRLVDTNRATLRSGDPNLVFAGEIVALPDV
jgi:hypothetical protein